MKHRTFSWLLSGAVFAAGMLAWISPGRADEWNKRTVITFSAPVEIPGMVLPAGTYVMQLADSPSDRDIVQFFNKDQSHIYNTVLAIPAYRMQATDKTVIQFEERAAGAPEAVKTWYYPGDLRGEEFLYNKTKPVTVAQATTNPSPQPPVAKAAPAPERHETQQTTTYQATTQTTPPPTQKPVEMAQARPVPAPSTPAPQTQVKHLPKTASDLPLVGLLGFVSLAAGAFLRSKSNA